MTAETSSQSLTKGDSCLTETRKPLLAPVATSLICHRLSRAAYTGSIWYEIIKKNNGMYDEPKDSASRLEKWTNREDGNVSGCLAFSV